MTAVRVKICGLTRREDAERAASAGAAFGGVILAPGGKRSVSATQAAAVLEGLPLRRVGVFVDAPLDALLRDARAAGLHVVQLHGDEDASFVRALRSAGQWTIWKAVRPRTAEEFAAAVEAFAPAVDGLLLDGWSAEARGGTGHRFPWEEVARVRGLLPPEVELIAAGGLNPGNVGRAVELLRPAVVDVSSGVELSPGVKDPAGVAAFVAAALASRSDPASPIQDV